MVARLVMWTSNGALCGHALVIPQARSLQYLSADVRRRCAFSLEWILDDQVGVVTINKDHPENRTVFLVPMNGGIWTLCVSLSGESYSHGLSACPSQVSRMDFLCISHK